MKYPGAFDPRLPAIMKNKNCPSLPRFFADVLLQPLAGVYSRMILKSRDGKKQITILVVNNCGLK